jgi:hypothetical protein
MNYFDELLESYNKLKKRTFKLEFISEDSSGEGISLEDRAYGAATQLVLTIGTHPLGAGTIEILASNMAKDLASNQEKATPASGEPSKDIDPNTKDEKLVLSWSGFGSNPVRYYNTFDDLNPTDQQKIINALVQDPSKLEDLEKDQNKEFASILGTDSDTPEMRALITQIYNYGTLGVDNMFEGIVKKEGGGYTSDIDFSGGKIPDVLMEWKRSVANKDLKRSAAIDVLVGQNVLGKSGLGTIFEGNTLVVDNTTGDSSESTGATPSLIYGALTAFSILQDFALNPDTNESCESIKGLLSDVKGLKNKRVMLKYESDGEGIIIPGGFALLKQIRKEIQEKGCDKSIETIDLGVGSDASISAKKGTLHESLTNVMFQIYNIRSKGGDITKARAELFYILKENKKVVDFLVKTMSKTKGWKTVSTELSENLVMIEDGLFKNTKEMSKFLNTYYKSMEPLLKSLNADAIVHAGKNSLTGARSDNKAVYRTRKDAEAAAERAGVEVQVATKADLISGSGSNKRTTETLKDFPDEVYVVGLGQKLYSTFSEPKMGENNNLERLMALISGLLGNDINISSGFVQEMDKRFPFSKEGLDFASSLSEDFKLIENMLNKESTYINKKGSKTKVNVAETCKSIVDALEGRLSFNQVKKLGIAKLDLNSEYGRAYLAEKIQRINHLSRLKEELKKGNPGAVELCIRSAFACGGNEKGIIQSMFTQDDNKVRNFPHNHFFDTLDMSTAKIEIEGNNIVITKESGATGKVSMSGTGSKGSSKRHVRSSFLMSTKAVDEAIDSIGNKEDAKPIGKENESIVLDFMNLLEVQNTLLNKLLG